jgi:hypothetical protein
MNPFHSRVDGTAGGGPALARRSCSVSQGGPLANSQASEARLATPERIGGKGVSFQSLPRNLMANVIGILICYSLVVILTMPDHFLMPSEDDGDDQT